LSAHPDERLLHSLARVFWLPMAKAAACKLVSDVLRYVPPMLLSRLLGCLGEHAAESQCSDTYAYALALALPLSTLLQALLVNQYFWLALRTGALVRGALAAAVCAHALAHRKRDAVDGGLLANVLSSDCGRINTACGNLNMAWSAPLQLLLALTLLWRALGPSVLGGMAVLVGLWPARTSGSNPAYDMT
jgi:ATP-binding cassette subfamily C (CFTR/MRP) protein 1